MLRRLIEKFSKPAGKAGYPRAQEAADVWHGILLTTHHRNVLEDKKEDPHALVKRLEKEDSLDLQDQLQRNLNLQIVRYFQFVHQTADIDPANWIATAAAAGRYTDGHAKRRTNDIGGIVSSNNIDDVVSKSTGRVSSSIGSNNTSSPLALLKPNVVSQPARIQQAVATFRIEKSSLSPAARKLMDMREAREAKEKDELKAKESKSGQVMRDVMHDVMGFSVVIKPSSIPYAGNGLFVEGTAPIGSVVGMFPGYVHLAQFLINKEYSDKLFPDEDLFLFSRLDNTLIDGRSAPFFPSGPLTCAHMTNHGGPNVLQLAYSYPKKSCDVDHRKEDAFPEELRQYIPNQYYREPSLLGGHFDRSMFCEGAVLVATRELRDEEILMDYRLNPALSELYPLWYRPIDVEASKRRWGVETEVEGKAEAEKLTGFPDGELYRFLVQLPRLRSPAFPKYQKYDCDNRQ